MSEQMESREGFDISFEIIPDDATGAPWEENDGHGDVSEWTTRAKRPGELVLCSDRGKRRFYDFAGLVAKALAEGWDAIPYNDGQETKGQQAAKAARADFERLRAWCNDEWHWCGVKVSVSRKGTHLGSASLWGLESDAGDYLTETANDLAEEALDAAKAHSAELTN